MSGETLFYHADGPPLNGPRADLSAFGVQMVMSHFATRSFFALSAPPSRPRPTFSRSSFLVASAETRTDEGAISRLKSPSDHKPLCPLESPLPLLSQFPLHISSLAPSVEIRQCSLSGRQLSTCVAFDEFASSSRFFTTAWALPCLRYTVRGMSP